MNELVSLHTQYLYHHFNGYNELKYKMIDPEQMHSLFASLLTIIRNANACCQITINSIFLPLTCINVLTVKYSSYAMMLSFMGK